MLMSIYVWISVKMKKLLLKGNKKKKKKTGIKNKLIKGKD